MVSVVVDVGGSGGDVSGGDVAGGSVAGGCVVIGTEKGSVYCFGAK